MADEGISVEIGANVDSLVSGARTAVASLSAVGLAMVGVGTMAAGAFAAASIEGALTFNGALETLERRAGFSRVAVADLRSAIDGLQASSVGALFAVGDATSALTAISTKGKSATDSAAILTAAMNLAAGSGGALSLEQSIELVNDILEAYGLTADDAAMVTDTLMATFDATGKPIDQIGVGLVNASRFAKAFGWDLNETAAVLSVLKDQGIDSVAKLGNALANVSGALALPLGVQVEQDGVPRDPGDIIRDVVARLMSMPEEDRTALIRVALSAPDGSLTPEAFGQAALLDTYLGRLDEINSKYLAIAGSAGIAEDAAKRFAESPQGQLQAQKAKLEELQTTLGEKLIPVLIPLAAGLGRIFELIEMISPVLGPLALGVAAYAVAAGIAAVASWGFSGALFFLGTALFSFVIPAIVALGLPLLAIAAVVALVALAWRNDWGGIQEKTRVVVDFIKDLWNGFTDAARRLGDSLSGVWSFVLTYLGVLWDGFRFVWGSIAEIVRTALRVIWAVVEPVLLLMAWLFTSTLAVIWNVVVGTFETIVAFIAAVMLTVKAIFTGDFASIGEIWSAFGDKLHEIWSAAGDRITSVFTRFGDWCVDSFRKLPGRIVEAVGDLGAFLWNSFQGWLHSVAERLTAWASGVLGLSPTLTDIGAMLPGAIVKGFAGAGDALWNGLKGGLSQVDEKIAGWVSSAKARLSEVTTAVSGNVQHAANAATSWASGAASNVTSALSIGSNAPAVIVMPSSTRATAAAVPEKPMAVEVKLSGSLAPLVDKVDAVLAYKMRNGGYI